MANFKAITGTLDLFCDVCQTLTHVFKKNSKVIPYSSDKQTRRTVNIAYAYITYKVLDICKL